MAAAITIALVIGGYFTFGVALLVFDRRAARAGLFGLSGAQMVAALVLAWRLLP